MLSEAQFAANLEQIECRINAACRRSGRARHEVKLMAVTKTQAAEAAAMALRSGLTHIGENRVQEAAGKRGSLAGYWELIGPLQSNKARLALGCFDRIQTVDRAKLVQVLARLCEETGREALPVLMQVNVGEDPAKHGCSVEDAPQLLEAILETPQLRLDGLMTIGELTEDAARIRRTFARLRSLRDQLEERSGRKLPELSMGMTGDLELAIEEGSTLIRVGTALFGAR